MKHMLSGLLRGDFSKWEPAQYGQYDRLLGNTVHVGIEIEGQHPNAHVLVPKLMRLSPRMSISWLVRPGQYTSRDLGEYEIQILWGVKQPEYWLHHLKYDINLLNSMGMSVLGGVHFNFQMANTYSDGTFHEIKNDLKYTGLITRNLWRAECKLGTPFLNWEDVVVQAIVLRQVCLNNIPKAIQLIDMMMDLYPKNRVQTSSDYDELKYILIQNSFERRSSRRRWVMP